MFFDEFYSNCVCDLTEEKLEFQLALEFVAARKIHASVNGALQPSA